MKKSIYHIVLARLLMFCFIAGQYMVYSHQHISYSGKPPAHQNAPSKPQTVIKENCPLCDAMQHNAMAIKVQPFFKPLVVSNYYYKQVTYGFRPIALVLAAGRAPPIA